MPRTCCIIGCNVTDTGSKITMFAIPKNVKVKEMWMNAISNYVRPGRSARRALHICEQHFRSKDVEKHYTTILTDGTIHKIKRDVPRLKGGAIPCFFTPDDIKNAMLQNEETHSEIDQVSSEEKMDYSLSSNVNKQLIDKNDLNNSVSHTIPEDHRLYVSEFKTDRPSYTLQNILSDVEAFGLPLGWNMLTPNDILVFVFCDRNFIITQVNVETGMKVTVRKLDCIITDELDVYSFPHFAKYLRTVQNLQPCHGIISDATERRPGSCLQLITPNFKSQVKLGFVQCSSCGQKRRRTSEMERRKSIRSIAKREREIVVTRNMKRKITCLENKVLSLQNEVNSIYEKQSACRYCMYSSL